MYLTEAITITPKGTVQANGTFPYDGTAVTTVARVVDKRGVTRSVSGDEIVYDKMFWLAPGETITLNDRITHNSVDHEVIDYRIGRDIVGYSHFQKVMVRVR